MLNKTQYLTATTASKFTFPAAIMTRLQVFQIKQPSPLHTHVYNEGFFHNEKW